MPAPAISDLLRACEKRASYGAAQVQVTTQDAEILVVSDLHLGPGKRPDGRFTGTENFFADFSFQRFIRHRLGSLSSRCATLIINGDMVDFLRTTGYPRDHAQFMAWQELLAEVGIQKTEEELRASISKKERKFGLQTDSYKSVWKLDQIMRGHPVFFDSLTEWIAGGRQLIVVKGNHDLEWYWPEVRSLLRLELGRRLSAAGQRFGFNSLEEALTECVFPQLMFVDDSLVIDSVLYIEHGHRYDKYAWVVGDVLLPGSTELNLPFGSFFNRYVLNRVELAFPYADNVRPASNLLPMLIRERFFVAMKLMLYQVPLALRTIPKGYYRYIFGQVAVLALAILVPLLVGIGIFLSASPMFRNDSVRLLHLFSSSSNSLETGVLSLILSYFLARVVAHFQLGEPDTLASNARTIFAQNPQYRFVTMGHTHNPDQFRDGDRYYFNTGTWIPIVEVNTADVREDKTYTFLQFRRGPNGELQPSWLERWDDESERGEDMVIMDAK